MKHLHNLEELFIEQLKEQYDGERQQLHVFPHIREQTSTPGLQRTIDHHIGMTRKQMIRMEHIFTLLDRNLHGETNKGVKGLLDEAIELTQRCVGNDLIDAGIIASIQHLNHHNIASYGTLCAYAEELKLEAISQLLHESLNEEKLTDGELTRLAETDVNIHANI